VNVQKRSRLLFSIGGVAQALARISRHPSTTAADASDLTGHSPSSRLDVVSTTPSPTSGPSTPSDRRLDALATMCGEKCGLARRAALWLTLIAIAQLTACAGMGPGTVNRDRFDYVVAISESWKRQTLLNLVKSRYVDAPVYMDITSVINQYAMEGEVELSFLWTQPNEQFLGGTGKYTDRPTITYSPLMGEKYTRSVLKPLPIGAIVLLLQSGYPADAVLRVCVQSINGLSNQRSVAIGWRDAQPEFNQVLELLQDLQLMNAIAFRTVPGERQYSIIMEVNLPPDEALMDGKDRLFTLLNLDASLHEFNIVFGGVARQKNQIAVFSRSLTQIMAEYAAFIEVPQSDVDEGRVVPTRQVSPDVMQKVPPLIQVRSGSEKPSDAYVAVLYRELWFWVDDTDLYSKTSLNFLMVLFALTEKGEGTNQAPVITVPTY
jgi:hypothetical protein